MLIYVAENTANGRVYVGATTRSSIAPRLREHRSYANCNRPSCGIFHKAIQKYGWDAFTWRIVEQCVSVEELRAAEQRWIASLGSNKRGTGYNQTEGGVGILGHVHSAETRAKLAASSTGRVKSEETLRKLSEAHKGRKPSAACIEALKRPRSAETRQKLREAFKGRPGHPWTPEQREKITASLRGRAKNGIGCKLHPDEAPAIFALRAEGISFAKIGARYGVDATTVFSFCHRHSAVAA